MISVKCTSLSVAEFAARACDWELTHGLFLRNETRVHGSKKIDEEVGHDTAGTIEWTHSGSFHVSCRAVESPAAVAHGGGNLLG